VPLLLVVVMVPVALRTYHTCHACISTPPTKEGEDARDS
jgi:hypothetical protein